MFKGGYVPANELPLITITYDRYWFVSDGERHPFSYVCLSTRKRMPFACKLYLFSHNGTILTR